MWNTQQPPEKIIHEKGLAQVSDTSAIEKIIEDVLKANPSSKTINQQIDLINKTIESYKYIETNR